MRGPKIGRLPIEQAILADAINYTKKRISEYYGLVATGIETNLQKPIWNQMKEDIDPINRVEEYLKQKQQGQSFFLMFNDESEYQFVMGIILSSLKLYQGQIKTILETTNVKGYDDLLTKITQALEMYKNGEKVNLFLKYNEYPKEIEKKPAKLFISYQQNDVQIACNIQNLIIQNSNLKKEDVFVAHRDISLSEEWRKRMIEQLESSTHLLALCTNNYLNSVFGNQEVGYAIAKHIKIAPIFWRETKRNEFGFLESLQSLPEFADNANLSEIIKKILERFDIH